MGEVFFNRFVVFPFITSSWRERVQGTSFKDRGPLLPPRDSVSALELGLGSHTPIQGLETSQRANQGPPGRQRWSGGLELLVDVKLLSVEG